MRMTVITLATVLSVTASTPAAGEPPLVAIEDQTLTVRTGTVKVVFEGAKMTSLRPAGRDVEFLHAEPSPLAIDIMYLNWAVLGEDKHQQVSPHRLSERAALITVRGADSERSLLVVADPDTGDVCITPDGLSTRRGVRAVRWTLDLDPLVTMTLPTVSGMRVRANHHYPPTFRFRWPTEWNAQFAILHREDSSIMIHCEDAAYHFKALHLFRHPDRTQIGFESEPPGSFWDNRTAGGITWRISGHEGGWKGPATRYRQWMHQTYDLEPKRRHRPAWTDRITLAVCWQNPDVNMLDALASVHPPDQTLIHLANWRTERYDINYPDYTPRDETVTYMKKAREMGFHVMPHFNYFAVYLEHPYFQEVRDFQYRTADQNAPEGWYWPPKDHGYTRMAYIHPGLGKWRHKLIGAVLEVSGTLGTDVAFIDQTLCTWNIDNGLVQGMTTTEGMHRMQQQFAAVEPGLVLVGEGLNEVSFQFQAFAQSHIFDAWQGLNQDKVDIAHDVCAFLWDGHTKLIGYHHELRPGNEQRRFAVEIGERMGVLPTIITNTPDHIRNPDELTRRILDHARRLGAD